MTNPTAVSTLDAMPTPPTPEATTPTGKTPTRAIRIPDELWAAAKAKAADNEETLSEVIRLFLDDYANDRVPGYALGQLAGRQEILDRLTQR